MTQIGGVQSVCVGVMVHLILGEYNNVVNLEGHKQQTPKKLANVCA